MREKSGQASGTEREEPEIVEEDNSQAKYAKLSKAKRFDKFKLSAPRLTRELKPTVDINISQLKAKAVERPSITSKFSDDDSEDPVPESKSKSKKKSMIS